MKFALSIIITALLAFAAGMYLGFWSLALAAFAVATFIPQKPWLSWLSGFFGLFLLWGILAWWIDMKNQHILSQRIAQLFHLGESYILLIFITAFVGGLVAGFAALTGSYTRKKS